MDPRRSRIDQSRVSGQSERIAVFAYLLATDAASEGIDLQNYCNCLIHIEIPYNPNVMEQRNGRVDRHGQKQEEVLIWHPVDGGEASEDTFGGHKDDIIRALAKLDAMREDMGSVNPVIAPQMAGLIEGTRRELDTRDAEVRAAKTKRYVHGERQLRETHREASRTPPRNPQRLSSDPSAHLHRGQNGSRPGKTTAIDPGRTPWRTERNRLRDAGFDRLVGTLHGRATSPLYG